jgi:hypothetical protein
MVHICSCKYPLIVIDERDEQVIEYLAFPVEVIRNDMAGEPFEPDIDDEFHEIEGSDGIIRQYVKVTWKEPDHDSIKRYDVVGHVVQAGCSGSESQCDAKNIYIVWHPLEEWINHHIVVLNKDEMKSK